MLLRLLLVFFSTFFSCFAQSLGHMHAIRTNTARNPNQPIAMSEKSSTFALGFDSEPNLFLNLRRINIRLSKVFFPALRSGRSAPSETVAAQSDEGTNSSSRISLKDFGMPK